MAARVPVGKTAELRPGQMKAIEIAGKRIALYNVKGTYFATDDACSHVGGSLSEGTLEGATVTCPWHGAQFDVVTGKVCSPPAQTALQRYPVHLEQDTLFLEIS